MNMDTRQTDSIQEKLQDINPLRHYRVKEAVGPLDLSEKEIRAFLESGELKGRRINKRGHWRIPGQSLLDFRFVRDDQ